MTELVNFIFHILKISNFRHKLAFKQVVHFFKVLQYSLNFTMTVFIKILGVQGAGSLGVIWLNTVVFLWILVNKHSVNISSNGNTQLIFYML